MAKLMEIIHRELSCSQDISSELARKEQWYLRYEQDNEGGIKEIGSIFEWRKKEFLTDLLRLWKLKVRGTLTLSVGDGKWLKYRLTEQGVEEYQGKVVFQKKPRIFTREEDIT